MPNEIKSLLAQKNLKECRVKAEEMDPADTAELIEELDEEDATVLFRLLSKETAAEVFSYLHPDAQEMLVYAITDVRLGNILAGMHLDDTVDFLEEMPASVVTRVLENVEPDRRDQINAFLKYEENSAGSLMNDEFVSLKEAMTVDAAFERIRKSAVNKESVYTCYITDKNRVLKGEISLKDLLCAAGQDIVSELMDEVPYRILTSTDREEVADLFAKYDLISAPVVDSENRLVGLITIDDVLDVVQEEATEDMEKMGALVPSERPYLKTGVFVLAKNRIGWLLFLMISGLLNGIILSNYQAIFAGAPVLVTFIPMLTDTGGNSGSQTSTLIIRGLAIGEIGFSDFLTILYKELRVSLICGSVLGAVNFLKIMVFNRADIAIYPRLPIVLAIATLVTIILAKTLGAILPIAAKAIHTDPALMAAPLLTTVVDAMALVIYFSIAKILLGV